MWSRTISLITTQPMFRHQKGGSVPFLSSQNKVEIPMEAHAWGLRPKSMRGRLMANFRRAGGWGVVGVRTFLPDGNH